MSLLVWTTKSTRNLAGALTAGGHPVSDRTVARMLASLGFSLQGNAKVTEGSQHADRDAQFRYLAAQVAEAMRELLVRHRPRKWPLVFAVDASTWARCDAETSPERGFYYSASKHSAGKPIVAGWSYSWITALDWAHDSWTAPMDARRIPPRADAVDVTATQVRDLVGRLGDTESPPLFCFDAGYDAIALTDTLSDVAADIVVADPR
jgi:hypothetical protein